MVTWPVGTKAKSIYYKASKAVHKFSYIEQHIFLQAPFYTQLVPVMGKLPKFLITVRILKNIETFKNVPFAMFHNASSYFILWQFLNI